LDADDADGAELRGFYTPNGEWFWHDFYQKSRQNPGDMIGHAFSINMSPLTGLNGIIFIN